MWVLLGLYELDEDGFLYELLGFLYELEEEGLFELDDPLEPPFRDSISMKMSKNINSRMVNKLVMQSELPVVCYYTVRTMAIDNQNNLYCSFKFPFELACLTNQSDALRQASVERQLTPRRREQK